MRVFDIIGEMGIMYTYAHNKCSRAYWKKWERVIKKEQRRKKQNAVPFDNAQENT